MTVRRFDSLDPLAGAYFERDLAAAREEILEDEQPPRNGFQLLPQGDDVPVWAETYEHEMFEPIGIAQFIADFADDLPTVEIALRKETFNVREFGCRYQYSITEIEKSAALGLQLERKKGRAARLAVEQKFNRIMWYGDPISKLFGALNYPHTPRRIIADPFDSTTTPATILAHLNDFVNSVFNVTETVAEPDTVLMSTTEYTHIAVTPWSENAGDTTILQHFLSNNPFVNEVIPVRELNGAGPAGENLMMAYTNTERVLSHKLVREFTQRAPQEKNLAIQVPCHARSGGVASDYPLEWVIGEFPSS